jgi:hypothetical protein
MPVFADRAFFAEHLQDAKQSAFERSVRRLESMHQRHLGLIAIETGRVETAFPVKLNGSLEMFDCRPDI